MATPPYLLPQRAAPLVNTGSAMDRHMSTGLSGQSPRPVGRSMNDPQRQQEIAMRRMRSQGDIQGAARLAQSQAWLDARFLGRNAPAMPAGAMPVLPSSPAADANAMPSGGRLVPGRSAGSMVVQRETPPAINVPTEAPPLSPMPMMPAPAAAPAAMPIVPEGMNPLTGMPFANAPSMMPEGFGAMNRNNAALGLPLPPSGLYGPEAAPMVSSIAIPGTDQMMPMIGGVPKGTPVAKTQPKPAAEWQPPKIYDEVVPEVRDANGQVKTAASTRQYYFVPGPDGKPRREYVDATPNAEAQQPGWMSWLEAQK